MIIGINIKVIVVVNNLLKVKEIVVGIRYCVCFEVLFSSGINLVIVVVVVRIMV